MNCRLCGASDFYDGAIDNGGSFVCIDCIANGEVEREEIAYMQPVNPFMGQVVNYPSECYDVDRYFPTPDSQ